MVDNPPQSINLLASAADTIRTPVRQRRTPGDRRAPRSPPPSPPLATRRGAPSGSASPPAAASGNRGIPWNFLGGQKLGSRRVAGAEKKPQASKSSGRKIVSSRVVHLWTRCSDVRCKMHLVCRSISPVRCFTGEQSGSPNK